MGNAARMNDKAIHDGPHCHAPIHPAAPVPTPVAHPPKPLAIIKGAATVMIGGQPAARVGDMTEPCALPSCTPAGPGTIAAGSGTVMIESMAAARVDDKVAFSSCVAVIPAPMGKIQGPGESTVTIG